MARVALVVDVLRHDGDGGLQAGGRTRVQREQDGERGRGVDHAEVEALARDRVLDWEERVEEQRGDGGVPPPRQRLQREQEDRVEHGECYARL